MYKGSDFDVLLFLAGARVEARDLMHMNWTVVLFCCVFF